MKHERAVERHLSPIEQGLLFHHFYGIEGEYVDQMICDVEGELDVSLVEQTIQRLVALHESLRTLYIGGRPGLGISALVVESLIPQLAFIDLSAEPDARAIVNRRASADARIRFDLSKQVSRCSLYRLGDRLHLFTWTYHHVLADSWTLRLLQEQFCAIYRALSEGRVDGSRATPYAAYVDCIASQDQKSVLNSWAADLGRLKSRRKDHSATPGARADRACLQLTLPPESRGEIDQVRRQFKVTTNVVLLAMWGILALDQQQSSDCLFGCVVFGRSIPLKGIEAVAGVCSNTVPVLIDEATPVRDLLVGLQRNVLTASARAYLAISDVLASAGLSHRDLHSVVNFTIDERRVKNKDIDRLPFAITNLRYTQAATFEAYLDIEVQDTGIEIAIHFDRRRRHFEASEINRKCAHILRCLAHHPAGTVRDVLDSLLVDSSRLDVASTFDRLESPRGGAREQDGLLHCWQQPDAVSDYAAALRGMGLTRRLPRLPAELL